ncbi:MAG: helix-turn-helix domain-containing protein [Fimbriimonas sp.]
MTTESLYLSDVEPGIVLTERQLKTWSVAPRGEIIEALLAHGAMTVGELAPMLGRKPKGLYYHLRALEEAGLIEVKEVRRASRRDEAVYGLVSRTMALSPDLSDPEYRSAFHESVAATLRKVERTHRRMVEAIPAHPELIELATLLQTTARLAPEDIRKLLETARDLHRQAKTAHDPDQAQAVMVTVLVLPVVPK